MYDVKKDRTLIGGVIYLNHFTVYPTFLINCKNKILLELFFMGWALSKIGHWVKTLLETLIRVCNWYLNMQYDMK